MDGEVNDQFMESLGSVLGYMNDLGCGASFSEFESWYLSIQEDLNNVLVAGENVPSASEVPLESLYEEYTVFCNAINVDTTPPTIREKVEEKPNNLGRYLLGGALLYLLFKKK